MHPRHPARHSHGLWYPGAPRDCFSFVLFRQEIETGPATDEAATLWVTASQRFRMWLDGREIAAGPSRAGREHWGVVEIRLPVLEAGRHILAAEVVHWGRFAGKGQVGGPGFFLAAGVGIREGAWRCYVDTSRKPLPESKTMGLSGHRAIGAGEDFEASKYPWGWQEADFHDSAWHRAEAVSKETEANPWGNRPLGCRLVEEPLPPMKMEPHPWRRRFAGGVWSGGTEEAVRLPPHERARFVYDAGGVLTAVPAVRWSGGAGATIRLTWCEAPLGSDGRKGDRDCTKGCMLPGQTDRIVCDGGEARCWSPPWIRAFRYLVVDVETEGDPLRLDPPTLRRAGFPIEPTLRIDLEDTENRPWDRLHRVSLDTALACAHETFFDCPSWEQAQFPGDARIQARHHYLLAGEERLALKAIRDLAASPLPSGLLPSHAPSSFHQVIATYSLQWIGMLEDYRVYRGRAEAIAPYLPQARAVLEWFLARRRSDGLPGFIDEPLFFDWAPGFAAGCAPQDADGGSAAAGALLAEACGWMAALEEFAGHAAFAGHWRESKDGLLKAIAVCRDPRSGLLADTPARLSYSVHAQVQATLAGFWTDAEAADILARALDDPSVTQPGTLYYRAHLAEALRRCRSHARAFHLFRHWFGMLETGGITTWPESDENPRSDCHGWGVMPDIEWVHTVAGLAPDPSRHGWGRCLLDPYPGTLRTLSATVPHPLGEIRLEAGRAARQLQLKIDSPVEMLVVPTGTVLAPGVHSFTLAAPD
ncbi:MAG: hypothetical protein JJU00_07380 [Opitutales bacterium]|nr:hypothetical protein [Opitutales bacterium]